MDDKLQLYVNELSKTLQCIGWGWPSLARLLDYLYLGDESDAKDITKLRELGITHVINCAESDITTGQDFYGDIKYMGFEGEDDDDYDIIQHFDDVYNFIESARESGGKVLIHCMMGVNRSGTLALAYIMMVNNIGPLSTAKLAKQIRRGMLMTNHGFQQQFIQFAEKKGMLEKDESLLPIVVKL